MNKIILETPDEITEKEYRNLLEASRTATGISIVIIGDKDRISRWCYSKLPSSEIASIDLVARYWPLITEYLPETFTAKAMLLAQQAFELMK